MRYGTLYGEACVDVPLENELLIQSMGFCWLNFFIFFKYNLRFFW